MITLKRTHNSNPDFICLVKQLDIDLALRDGDDHDFYAQFNSTTQIKYVVVAYMHKKAIACGAIKEYEPDVMEIKRMFTLPECRSIGVATKLLGELEKWAAELNYKKCILETGIKQPEAIALYKKNNYSPISNYGQYADVDDSVCFEKILPEKQIKST